MDFIQLQTFIAVVDSGGFSAAAKELHMAHSTITNQIQRLEKECNCSLLQRNTRRVALTTAGGIFYRYARQLVNLQTELKETLVRLPEPAPISIAAISTVLCGLLPGLLAKYRLKRPQVKFSLYQQSANEVTAHLRANRIAIGFVDSICEEEGIACVLLGKSRRKLLVANNDLYRGLTEETISEKNVLGCCPYIITCHGDRMLTSAGKRSCPLSADTRENTSVIETENIQNVINYVRSGLGIASVPGYLADTLASDPGLRVFSCLSYALPTESVYLLYKSSEEDKAVLEFRDFIIRWAKYNEHVGEIACYR